MLTDTYTNQASAAVIDRESCRLHYWLAGPDDGGEPPEQGVLLRHLKRHRVPDASGQRLAVAQQEKQQMQHDKKS